jgi:hypothetical protein
MRGLRSSSNADDVALLLSVLLLTLFVEGVLIRWTYMPTQSSSAATMPLLR